MKNILEKLCVLMLIVLLISSLFACTAKETVLWQDASFETIDNHSCSDVNVVSPSGKIADADIDCRFWNAGVYVCDKNICTRFRTNHFVVNMQWLDDQFLLCGIYMGSPIIIDIIRGKEVNILDFMNIEENETGFFEVTISNNVIEIIDIINGITYQVKYSIINEVLELVDNSVNKP